MNTEDITCNSLTEQYKNLKDIAKQYADAVRKDGLHTEQVKELKSLLNTTTEELRSAMDVYKEHFTSPEQAREIMGEDRFIGPEDIHNTFGFTPEDIPEIPFSREELTRAKDLGHQLILYVDTKEGEPFTLRDILDSVNSETSAGDPVVHDIEQTHYFTDTRTRPGWRLTSPEVTDNTTNKNYLQQTEVLINYLKDEVFRNQDLPESYQTAIDEFEAKKDTLHDLISSDWHEAARQLSELTITQTLRENTPEVIYRLIITERKNTIKNLENTSTWTTTLASDGSLVHVGRFDSHGLNILRWPPGYLHTGLGACLSRSGS